MALNTARPLSVVSAIALVFGALSPLTAGTARACSCVSIEDVAQPVGWSDVIVIGTVTGVRTQDPGSVYPDQDAIVSVDTYLKGSGPSEIVADDGVSSADCGMFNSSYVGREMLLFLNIADGRYTTSSCSGNHIIEGDPSQDSYVIAVVDVLNPAALPATGAGPRAGEPTTAPFPALKTMALALLIPAMMLGTAALWPRR
jgi:hypothetical protein